MIRIWHTVVAATLVLYIPAAAQTTVVYPDDGDSSLQSALDRAGCGGVLRISPGTYYEGLHGPGDPPSTFPTVCDAGMRVIGAGVDKTTLVMAAPEPNGRPLISFGIAPSLPPPAEPPLSRYVELAHMTVLAALTDSPSAGVGFTYSSNTYVHDLRIIGFVDGLLVDQSTNATIENVEVIGPGCPPPNQGVRGIRLWTHPTATPGLLHGDHLVRNVTVSDVCTGVFIRGDRRSSVHHSSTLRTRWGIRSTGAGGLDLHHNVIRDSTQSGVLLLSTDDSLIHQNTICFSPVGLDYTPVPAVDDFGFGTSNGNQFQNNTLIGVGLQVQGALQADNTAKHNTDTTGACP